MPARPAVMLLPDQVLAALNERLIKRGFSGYEELSAWLEAQGFQISKSALHRYGQKFEERVQALKLATDQAKAIVEVSPDDEGAISEALMRLVQEKLFAVLLEFEIDPKRPPNLAKLAQSIAQLGRASVNQKKYMAEVRDKARTAADAVAKVAKRGGMSEDTVDLIRREILGIAR